MGQEDGAAERGGAWHQLREMLEMIKFQHTLFALPFAFTGMLAAGSGLPAPRTLLLIVACMVTARTAAMVWNRLTDSDFDAANPRTADRAIPAGRVSRLGSMLLLFLSVVLFVAACAALNRATLLLCPIALVVVLGYSLTKRFTWATHFVLGLALAIAPVGAWLAVTGALALPPFVLAAAVFFWTAGFDLLYSCQDAEFDREHGLHSLPARFGIPAALRTARFCHLLAAISLVGFGVVFEAGSPYFVLVTLAAAVMAWSHSMVSADDLSRVGMAFFQANVAVSLLVLTGTALEVLMFR